MITPLESRILDRNSECLGVSIGNLMENAGACLAGFVKDNSEGRVLFICGSGNNGGDGYAAYRHISGISDVCAFREPKSDLCREVSKGLKTIPYDGINLGKYRTIVDCVLGTGMSGKLRQEYSNYIKKINSSGKRIISCDVPTGFGTSEQVLPYATVTFHDMKEGMSRENCGIIEVCDIGIPKEAAEIVNKGDFLRYPVPGTDSHKGQNGRLVIVGGGPYIGAPIMAALSSLRAGTDLVTVMTPKSSFVPIAAHSPAYMVRSLSGNVLSPEDIPAIETACSKADAVLIGPGLGTAPETAETVRELVRRIEAPIVIDADGITCIKTDVPDLKNITLTPHSRELSSLIGKDDPSDEEVADFCKKKGCVILRKGPVDRIYSPSRMRSNRTGTPGMTVGGTGDVLAGLVAGLISKGMDRFDAACLGAYISGAAGELAFDKHSYGMSATDVIDNIGRVLKEGLE